MVLNSTTILAAIMLVLPLASRQEAAELAASVLTTGDQLVLTESMTLVRTSGHSLRLVSL
jgi:hypothetical protein